MEENKTQKEILKLWELIQKKFSDNFDVKNVRMVTRLDKYFIPQLYFEKKRKKKKSENFEISFNDGRKPLSTKEMAAEEVLLSFIDYVGVDNVISLGIKTKNGKKLISDDEEDADSWKPLNGKYVCVKTGSPEKANNIQRIINGLNIDAKITYL